MVVVVVGVGVEVGRGLAGPPADVITVEQHLHENTYEHTHTHFDNLGQLFIFLSACF